MSLTTLLKYCMLLTTLSKVLMVLTTLLKYCMLLTTTLKYCDAVTYNTIKVHVTYNTCPNQRSRLYRNRSFSISLPTSSPFPWQHYKIYLRVLDNTKTPRFLLLLKLSSINHSSAGVHLTAVKVPNGYHDSTFGYYESTMAAKNGYHDFSPT